MLNEQDNHRSRKLVGERRDDVGVDNRNLRVLEASWDFSEDGKLGIVSRIPVGQPADHGVQQNDESCAKGGNEEPRLALAGLLSRHEIAEPADQVEKEQCRQAHRSIEIGPSQMLEDVDDDLVCRLARAEASDTHEVWHLTDCDVDCGARHERRDGSKRDEFNDPSKAREAKEAHNSASDDCEGRGDLERFHSRKPVTSILNNSANKRRHNSNGLKVKSAVVRSWDYRSQLTPIVISLDVAKNQ